ncbi:MAG: leucyl/phenylalanyl-tRNA--protein transferase [Polyangiaceae bacterium]|nr:leucyl/phenylalanyl-tRNA--protein transferase [Polyangiaceae bacterium]
MPFPFADPIFLDPQVNLEFPDPRDFDDDGLIAGGGDLSPQRLLKAYRQGIFPWYSEEPILWWSPNPRAILNLDSLHISRSLKRRLRNNSFRVSVNQAPERVMDGCAQRPEGTWLTPEMKSSYLELFRRGHLMSYEVWRDEDLVGGLYGVLVGRVFAAESKFHRATDASKVALVCALTQLSMAGLEIFDVQFQTEHLASLGVFEIPRNVYVERVQASSERPLDWGPVPEQYALSCTDLLPWVRTTL